MSKAQPSAVCKRAGSVILDRAVEAAGRRVIGLRYTGDGSLAIDHGRDTIIVPNYAIEAFKRAVAHVDTYVIGNP